MKTFPVTMHQNVESVTVYISLSMLVSFCSLFYSVAVISCALAMLRDKPGKLGNVRGLEGIW